MNLTDEQREILCVCVGCGTPIDNEAAGDALESGRLQPSEIACDRCHNDTAYAERVMYYLANVKAAEFVADRIVRAGLGEEYAEQARERVMRRNNEQN